jgi:hypothetical protein
MIKNNNSYLPKYGFIKYKTQHFNINFAFKMIIICVFNLMVSFKMIYLIYE